MISAREASIGIYGAWQLAKFDAQGLRFFDNSVEAFWRSFYASVIVLPAYAILVLLRLTEMPVTQGSLAVLMVEGTAYVIGWTAFPLVMHALARMLDRSQFYCRYIAAYNWSMVLRIALFLLVTATAASGILPAAMAGLITFVAIVAILAYQWFIARVGLEVSAAGACGIVFLDLVISLVLDAYTNALLRGHGVLG